MGPTIQFKSIETISIFTFLKTFGSKAYFTFAKGGYIININPIAMGILVEPLLKELIKLELDGKKYPMLTPMAMATNIHSVRKRSRKLSFFMIIIVLNIEFKN